MMYLNLPGLVEDLHATVIAVRTKTSPVLADGNPVGVVEVAGG